MKNLLNYLNHYLISLLAQHFLEKKKESLMVRLTNQEIRWCHLSYCASNNVATTSVM